MIVIKEVQRKILKAIFEEEVKANEIMLELKKIDERAAEEQRNAQTFISFEPIGRPNALPKGFKSKTGKREAMTLFQVDAVCHEQIAELEVQLNSVTETISKLEYEAVQKSEDRFKVPEKKKREISKLTSRLNHLTNFQKIISKLQHQREKYATNLEKIEKGTTSGMIEKHGVNRKTFTENIDSLIEENLIEESLTKKSGEQTWKYYKTTILGKVLIFKSMKVVREGEKMTIVDIPSEASYFGESDGEEKYRMAILAFFYNYLERLKKFDLHEAQIQDTGIVWDLEIPENVLYDQLPDAMFNAFSFIDITKLDENRELATFWGHEGHYQDPEYGVSIMVPILPEAGFTPKSTIQPMTEMEMRDQREEREEKFPEPGPLGEKGWFVNISAYFRLDEWNPKTGECEEEMVIKTRTKMFDFIEDVLTFNFLVNLKTITGNLKAASPATKKLFKDPDLNKFYNNMLNELVERSGSLDSYLKKYKI